MKSLLLSVIFMVYFMADQSQQAIYPYHMAVSKTLRELDLKLLDGHWYGVYHRNPKSANESCPQLDITVGTGYVNVTESRGNNSGPIDYMEQNQYLKGKLSKVIWVPEGYAVERPWFITQVDPVLVVYQVTHGAVRSDNWSVYSRNQTTDQELIKYGSQLLREAGAVRDTNGKIGYHCTD
ncbi:uncharacterized protein LOC128955994 [Oppia nitens]|uniref:uncharacterized protein LOC128955994 n=1 Tax=Oppia nitens TaxID=1686743 RepID=UPI0023DB35CE|nr:uncharacterized protein LOC128955994 [Oppia nitens]